MTMNYICLVNYYCNCRRHDGITSTSIKFFKDVHSLMDFLLKEMNTYEITEIYGKDGELLNVKVEYELGSHNVNGIMVTDEDGIKIRTIDDGQGNLRWSKENENLRTGE